MHGDHIAPQILADPPLNSDSTLHVIGVISNYAMWNSRYRLFRAWYERMKATPNVKVYVVETAFGDRAHEITSADEPTHLQLRTESEIWTKENMINLGVRRLLPRDWRYLAWVDCDIEFRDPTWAVHAMHEAQRFGVLQPWQSAADLGPQGQIMRTFDSFGAVYQSGVKMWTKPGDPYKMGHSGFAWVCTRAWYEAVGGLFEIAILGSGDAHMAWASIGRFETSLHGGMSAGFKRAAQDWQTRAMRFGHGEVGFSRGRIEHSFHGPKVRRAYRERWQILVDHAFDPFVDLRYDAQGVLQLVGKPKLEKEIRAYNRARSEDSIDE